MAESPPPPGRQGPTGEADAGRSRDRARERALDDPTLRELDTDPPYLYRAYRSTRLRAPGRPLVLLPGALREATGPIFGPDRVGPGDSDLTRQHAGEPVGERIIVSGTVRDADGRPARHSLVEIWQANASGRYRHQIDDHDLALDPNFSGFGRVLTDDEGRYRFITVKPGPYPWANHDNAWRPAHIHFSVFGSEFPQRLVTQMYFEGDPLFFQDPIFNSIPRDARPLVIAGVDLANAKPGWALAYRFDIVLRGRHATPFEHRDDRR
jgi:protocatechuate 3,4-dioxygenase beta subunit